MSALRIGYVGCGFMAQRVHLPNIQSIEDCELVALAEVRPILGKKVQEHFRVPKLYRDHHELAADKEIQAAAVSGHYAGQGELAIDLLRAGKDVFMEKPMAVSVEQAERILDVERRSGKRLMVGYMKRYDGGNVLVKELMDKFRASGALGKIQYVRNHGFCGDWAAGLDNTFLTTDEPKPEGPVIRPAWMPEKYYARYIGYLQQYTHNVNLVRWFLNAGDQMKVETVALDPQWGMLGVVIFDVAGCRAIIESGMVKYHGWDEHTQIYFDQGWIRTEAPPLLLRNVPATVEVYRADQGHVRSEMFSPSGWTWSYKEEMKHFVQCVQTGAPFRSPASDAYVDVRVFEEIYRKYIEAVS